MVKIGILSTGILLMTLSGCTNGEEEDVEDAPGASVHSSGGRAGAGGATGGPVMTGSGGYESGGTAGTAAGGYGTGGTVAEGGSSWDCQQSINDCYADAYACCGQGVDEQCEALAGTCASIICPDPYPYPLACSDYIVPLAEGADEIQAFELAVNTCANYGLTATSAELLELGVFVTCCPDPNGGGGMGTAGTGWGGTGTGGGWASGSGGYEEMGSGSGGFSTGGTGMGGTGMGGIGTGGSGPVIPGFCSGMGGEGGVAGEGGEGGVAGEGGFATGGMPAD